jgi:hypothetical protein
MPTLTLINLHRFVEHVEHCPDPSCGFVISIDGTCKVFREHCGNTLPAPSNDSQWDREESDVHNAVAQGFLRQSICSETPAKGKNSQGNCKKCATQLAISRSDPLESQPNVDGVPGGEKAVAYTQRLRSANQEANTQAPLDNAVQDEWDLPEEEDAASGPATASSQAEVEDVDEEVQLMPTSELL